MHEYSVQKRFARFISGHQGTLGLNGSFESMNLSLPIITLDIDWAPDWTIEDTASILIKNKIKATWFITHRTKAIDRLQNKTKLFELGLHPNCLPESSHGNSEDEVLTHVRTLIPQAVSMRTHGLYQSSNFLKKAAKDFGVKNDVSLILPGMHNLKKSTIALLFWRV